MGEISSRAQGLIAVNIAAVTFGSAALFGKLSLSPFWIVDMRAAFAVLALLVLALFRKSLKLPPFALWPTIVATGVILALHWLLFFASVQISGIAIATLTFAAFPLCTVFIETFHQRRKPHPFEIIAAVAIVIAVGLLINPREGHESLLGIGSGLASAVTFAWFGHASKQLGKLLSPLHVSLFQNSVVAIVLAPFLFFIDSKPSNAMDWVWLALLGIVTTALMHQLYFYSLKRLSASICSGFVALEPVYAILFAAALFHEPISLMVAMSAFMILAASYILLKFEPQSGSLESTKVNS